MKAHVEADERRKDTEVPPVMRVEDVKAPLKECVCRAIGAVPTRRGRVRVCQVSTCDGDKGAHVGLAREARGRLDRDELDVAALDGQPPDGLAEDSFDEVAVWRDAVHPLPPTELTVGLQDAVAG